MEDVHWADDATIDLLRFLGRRIRDAAVLLIATYRDEGLTAGDPLRVALGDLATQRSTRRVGLAPLTADGVRILAGGSGLAASALYRLTGGNPFYVTEVLRAGMGKVPASARDAVLARAARLGSESRGVLDIAALTGTRVELRLLESVTGCPPAAIDELLACGLLTTDGEWLRFRHEIARLAVEQAIAAHRRGAAHTRILDVLRAQGCADDARLAFHAEAAGDAQAVLRYAPAAARRAAQLASHREAAAQYERALRFAAQADTAMAAGLYDGLADEMSLVDRSQDAADACAHALALWRQAGNELREGDTLRRLYSAMWNLCRGPEAAATAEAAVSILEPLGPTKELAWAYSSLARQRMLAAEHDAATGLALRAQAIAEALSVSEVLSDALNTRACATAFVGAEWAGQMRQALEIALAGRLHEQAGRAYANFCGIYGVKRQFADAGQYLTDGIAYCDEHDLTAYATFLRGEQSHILEKTGCWDESVTLSTDILAKAGPSPANRLCTLKMLGRIRIRRGDPRGWEYLDEAVAAADGTGEPPQIVAVRLVRAEGHWLDGKPAEARREAELADDVAASCDEWDRGAVAVWLHRTGSARPPRGDLARPYQRELDGDWQQAATIWTGLRCPYDAAMALVGAPEEAALRAALSIFTGLGASPAAQITRQQMRAIGVRSIPAGPRTTTRAHPLGLTGREREVLDLICAGHTNAEIAANCSSPPGPSITTSPPCWPNWAPRAVTPLRPKPPVPGWPARHGPRQGRRGDCRRRQSPGGHQLRLRPPHAGPAAWRTLAGAG